MMDQPASLGQHLRNRRFALGLRQGDVAMRLGTIREVYDRWERDLREPVVSEWPALLSFLGCYPFPEQNSADLVLKARRCQGADQKALAAAVGVIPQRLRRWEHGNGVPRADVMRRLVELACIPNAIGPSETA